MKIENQIIDNLFVILKADNKDWFEAWGEFEATGGFEAAGGLLLLLLALFCEDFFGDEEAEGLFWLFEDDFFAEELFGVFWFWFWFWFCEDFLGDEATGGLDFFAEAEAWEDFLEEDVEGLELVLSFESHFVCSLFNM